jgi:DNA-binding NarL/FixJ family response regulator
VNAVRSVFDRQNPIRVFLCDDVQAFRALMRFTLEEDPCIRIVGEAGDGNAGVRGVADTQPDVVLLDLSMPDCDGFEAIPQMRESAPEATIVALSGFGAERMAGPVLACGAHAYLEKGEDLERIRIVIRQAAVAA